MGQRGVMARVRAEVSGLTRGTVVTSRTLLHLGARTAVDQALSRLAASGDLTRVGRGVYCCPGKTVTVDAVTRAIAGEQLPGLLPSGALAAWQLGLLDQPPDHFVFLTNGAKRTLRVGHQTIELRRTTWENVRMAGRISCVVTQALRHLGRSGVTHEALHEIQSRLTMRDRACLEADARLVPAWIRHLLRGLAAGLYDGATPDL
jgi:hypothetical protein